MPFFKRSVSRGVAPADVAQPQPTNSDLGGASWQRLKSLKLEGNAYSPDDALRSFGGKIKQYVLDKSCFTDLDPERQLGITFSPWPTKVEVSGEPTIRLLSTETRS